MFTCWFIGKWRNQRVLGAELEMPSNPKPVIFLAVYEWYIYVQRAIKPRIKIQIIKHIYHEQNVATDALATRNYNLGPGLHLYDELNVDGTRKTASGAMGLEVYSGTLPRTGLEDLLLILGKVRS
ncbi:PREDICTED: putative ribonuclease H At1g65750 [Prunus dulcis]|uniref:PREDICTED: putative ribonuclease H At1g65750 n=1 Tax=Prunus dulcis TaxID=3755 RepID=A0A5E4G2T5_PRUDU|nr:PREDICTED: putative ribonuclease H At1g65750 [Prunus dulcis]